ncbi:MAG: response regulator [Actinobacteria bacterium]|nr:response regulator [Actinomycetota bacterium]
MTSAPSAVPDDARLPEVPVTVVVVDDDPDVRLLVRHKLRRAGMELVGEACDGADAVEVVHRTQPDVVLLDLHMPGTSGDEALPHLVGVAPSAMVVIFSAGDLCEAGRRELLRKGAAAYYDKADAFQLSDLLTEDLARFRRATACQDGPRLTTVTEEGAGRGS